MICSACNNNMEERARFCSQCGRAVITPGYAQMASRLTRPRLNRMIAGVCSGFAQQYGWDVTAVRLVFVLAVLLGAGMPLLVYFVAWIIMPNEPYLLPGEYKTYAGPTPS